MWVDIFLEQLSMGTSFPSFEGFLDIYPERFIMKMFSVALKRSLRVSTRPVRPTDNEVLEHIQLLEVFVQYIDELRNINEHFNSLVPRDLLLFMIHQYSAGISIAKPMSINATRRRFKVKNSRSTSIILVNTPPEFFTSLVENHLTPYFEIIGGSFDQVSADEFENLVAKLLDFSWSALEQIHDPVATAAEQSTPQLELCLCSCYAYHGI